MPIQIKNGSKTPAKKNGHTKAKAPTIKLSEPGRLRVSNIMALLGISHSTLYAGIKTGRYPKSDGRDGKFPYWNTSTIMKFLEMKVDESENAGS